MTQGQGTKVMSEMAVILERLNMIGEKLDRDLSEINEGLNRIFPYHEPEQVNKAVRNDIPSKPVDHHVGFITDKLDRLDSLVDRVEAIRNHVNKIG